MRPLGKHQLCLLASMASPFSLVVVGDGISRSLVKRGLLGVHWNPRKDRDGFLGITPAGLRTLADQMQAGKLEQFLDPKYERDRARLYISARASPERDE